MKLGKLALMQEVSGQLLLWGPWAAHWKCMVSLAIGTYLPPLGETKYKLLYIFATLTNNKRGFLFLDVGGFV